MTLSRGIDVHKASLQVAIADGTSWRVPTTPTALQTLGTRLTLLRPDVVGLEPRGGDERPVLEMLWAHHLPAALVQPRQVRACIRGQGVRAKSDPLDARMLAWFGLSMTPRLVTAPTPRQRQVQDLVRHRRTLVADVARWKHRQQQADDPMVQASIHHILTALTTEIAAICATIHTLVTTAPEWQRIRQILLSAPGIGAISVALLLAELPELGQVTPKQLAALVGVAPMTQQRGDGTVRAPIEGGRRTVRDGLWMPTMTAMRHNPTIRRMAERMQEKSRPHKVIVIACMHKLLTILNAMVTNDQVWEDRPQTA